MKRLYLDSNVVLDFLLDRVPFAEAAQDLLQAGLEGRVELLVSSLTFITSHYVVSKAIGKTAATQALVSFMPRVQVIAVGDDTVGQALQSGRPDFEDAVQFYTALAAGAEAIVTRDPKGFPASPIPVLNPLATLAQL